MATNTTTLKIITMFKRSKENYSTWREKRVENGVQMAPTNLLHFFYTNQKKWQFLAWTNNPCPHCVSFCRLALNCGLWNTSSRISNGTYKAHITGQPHLVHHAKKAHFGGNLMEPQLWLVWDHFGSVHPAPLPTLNFLHSYYTPPPTFYTNKPTPPFPISHTLTLFFSIAFIKFISHWTPCNIFSTWFVIINLSYKYKYNWIWKKELINEIIEFNSLIIF